MKIRKDGKSQLFLLLIALFGGLFGSEFFYFKKTKLGFIRLGISFASATIITTIYVIYASVEVPIDFDYQTKIVIPIVLLGIPIMLMFLWSLWTTFQIATGKFKDEFGVPVGQWNATPQDVANYLVNL